MTWKSRDLELLLTEDVDQVVERGQSLHGKERTAALRNSLDRLAESTVQTERLKVLLFIQSLLAAAQDGRLHRRSLMPRPMSSLAWSRLRPTRRN